MNVGIWQYEKWTKWFYLKITLQMIAIRIAFCNELLYLLFYLRLLVIDQNESLLL